MLGAGQDPIVMGYKVRKVNFMGRNGSLQSWRFLIFFFNRFTKEEQFDEILN